MEAEGALESLGAALPEKFSLYHLGEVTGQPDAAKGELSSGDDSQAVSFRLHGDAEGVLLVLFERGLDVSLYTELGNIIASQAVTRLQQQKGLEVMISPPRLLGREQLAKLLASLSSVAIPHLRRTYLHTNGRVIVPVETLYLPILSEGMVGYA